jgi:DNA polymerase sigma
MNPTSETKAQRAAGQDTDGAGNLGSLLVQFLQLYGSRLNFEDVGISVRNGGEYYSKRQRYATGPAW